MKAPTGLSVSLFLMLAALALALPGPRRAGAAAGAPPASAQSDPAPTKAATKVGPEAAARARQLKANHKSVKAALKVFERRGHAPKIEDSWIITDKARASAATLPAGAGQAAFRKAALRARQDSTSTAEGEIVFIPTLSLDGEWHGTIVITAYDSYGNFVNDYVADVVMLQNHSTGDWRAVYEVGFESGVPYLSWQEGMYAGFAFGTPLANQPPPPSTLEGWQEYSPSFDPAEGVFGDPYDPNRPRGIEEQQQAARSGGVNFRPARFAVRQDRGFDYRYRQGRCPCDPPPAVRAWGGCLTVGCSAGATTCRLPGPLTAVCLVSRCGGAAVGCAVKTIFGW